ncbi:hypothetical protein EDB80DRAFT_746775 [Ilyonectria destructans]|nr:hypothetical protein EDB80DRAFT_746775 [Ilyonectria destructans]
MAPQELEKRDLSKLALICRGLFNRYATLDPACSAPRKSAARQQERFSTSDLAVFTRPNTSLDCDEIRALAIEQLVVIQTNLEFEFPGKSDVLSSPKDAPRREWIRQLEGTPSEALEAVEATIFRLDDLGEAIRQRPALNQGTQSCNDYAGAETIHQQMMHPSSQLSSPEHPQSLSSMVEIAKALFRRRKYQEAEEEYRKALKLHAKVMEANGPCIISIKGNLANALAKQGKHREAENLYGEMWALSTETLGEKHPHTLSCRSNLASLLEKRGEYTKAEEIYRNVWELQRTTLGDNHRDTLSSNSKLANALMRLKEFNEATVLGEEHPDSIITLGNFANSLQNQGQFEEAKAKYLEAIELGTKVLDHEHPHLRWIRIRREEARKDEGE